MVSNKVDSYLLKLKYKRIAPWHTFGGHTFASISTVLSEKTLRRLVRGNLWSDEMWKLFTDCVTSTDEKDWDHKINELLNDNDYIISIRSKNRF